MPILISKSKQETKLIDAVEEISGIDIRACLQCKKCSNGCPVNGMTKISPSEIIRKLQLNAEDEFFKSDLIWMCASCETCYSRCPMKINMASVIDALRILSLKKNTTRQKNNVSLFNKSFLKTVKMFGRTYDLGMIAAYKIGSSSYFQDTEKFPMMLKKGKIALFPSLTGDKKNVKMIFNKILKNKSVRIINIK
jgi:heterodisulfide reductase subunit C